nr:MAG TPA: hypothetical protein [Bacteriophage sp.]
MIYKTISIYTKIYQLILVSHFLKLLSYPLNTAISQ